MAALKQWRAADEGLEQRLEDDEDFECQKLQHITATHQREPQRQMQINSKQSRGEKKVGAKRSEAKACGRQQNVLKSWPSSRNELTRHLFILLFLLLSSTCTSLSPHQVQNAVEAQGYDSPASTTTIVDQSSTNQGESSSQSSIAASATSNANSNVAAACFGGLQTFEKISMSSFENPGGVSSSSSSGGAGNGGGGSFGSGILIQQDDQALTSECINLCRSQANCLSFVIDYNKFECKSYATTQQELAQEFASKFQNARQSTPGNPSNESAAEASSMHFQQLLPSTSSNYFEKICLDGVANRNQFSDVCGQNRLWTVERVVDSFLDGFVEKEVTNVNNKDECSKLCIFETQFVCRSADYDQQARLCRLSKEDRRTQPQAMRHVASSNRQYLENQCATPGPSSCVYEIKKNLGIISMDALKFAQTQQDCQMKCNQETTFNCRSYSFHQQRCFLSGDDSVSLNSNSIRLPQKLGWTFGEKRCLVELCTKGIFSYEKITGFTLRSALSTSIDLMMQTAATSTSSVTGNNLEHHNLQQQESSSQVVRVRHLMPSAYNQSINQSSSSSLASAMMNMMSMMTPDARDPLQVQASSYNQRQTRAASTNNLAITEHCRHSCDLGYLNCPAFTIDYKNNRCQRLDRNSQGRHHELVARDGFAYYEKICLRVPEIMSMCQDKYWIFERVIGYELAPRLYDKSLKFVQSRRDCEEYCLEERQFQCRSALYNDETSDCKLSRYERRLALQEGAYYRNFNARISYLENNCVRDRGDLEEKKQCYYEKLKEEPVYPTFTERIEMATPPPAGPPPTGQGTNNNSVSSVPAHRYGASYCEQLCNDNSKFECHSFGYYASTAQCFLSSDDSISAGELATTPSTGFTYYEKRCRLAPLSTTSNSTTTAGDDASGAPTSMPPAPAQNPYFQPASPQRDSLPSGETGGAKPVGNSDEAAENLRPYAMPMPTRSSTLAPSSGSANSTGGGGGDPNLYKCGVGHSFVYQRISGFEPIGGYLTLLVKNNEQPGIVSECSDLCKRAFECRAFVVDYNNNQCFAMLENSSVGLLSLRQTLGKDYFEGFCLANHLIGSGSPHCKDKTWIVDKIVDQAVVGVQHQRLIQDSDRSACRQACFEERFFWCKSAMFDGTTNECKLYSIDRESMPQMRLLFTKGVDFFENQCQINSNSCPYDAIERDMTIVSITKSLQARSTFDCELACNSELAFNCRSYTYLDQLASLPTNMCLLSSDSRSTSQRGSVRAHSRTLYAERNCYYRRPRYPGGGSGPNPTGSGHHSSTAQYDATAGSGPTTGDTSYGASRTPEVGDKYGGVAPSRHLTTEVESAGGPYDSQPATLGLGNCEPHQYTFERTFGHDYKLAHKERAPIAPTIGIAIGCQQECLKRADKCQAFVVEYALPYQSCFLLETQAGANKKLLVKSPHSAYFEKVCLPRTGLQPEVTESNPVQANKPIGSDDSQDILPSYSQEPWSLQSAAAAAAAASQLPYYLQQQQLVQHYPSRSCAKLWTFERFVDHNFTAQADKLISDSLSRVHCETQCLNEASFSCRSLTYDYAQNLCRLFKNTRRTMNSHFIDLESPTQPPPPLSQGASSLANSHPGSAHVIDTQADNNSEIQMTSASGESRRSSGARQLMMAGSSATGEPDAGSKFNIDYLENTCTPEPSSCQYRQLYDQFSPYIDKVTHAISLGDCQRQCDQERLFSCKSINYDPLTRSCMLVNEDLLSLARGTGSQVSTGLMPKKQTIYSEKGNCEMISVQCNSQEMLVAINFDSPFRGRVMAKGNPEQCYLLGDGQTQLQFPIAFGPKCNSRQEGHNTFVNEVIIQQHPVIMTDSDKTIRVMCAFEAPDQTITLKTPNSRDGNKTGIDVAGPSMDAPGRTRHDKQQFNSVVSNKAAPPSVVLRILDVPHGRDAQMINLGDDLMLKIQMQMTSAGKSSALGIFARNLAARSSNGESLLLIDNDGCPVDPQVFPALEIDPKDGRSLQSTFKAFRFPSSGLVNFEVQIRFCPERCQPVECNKSSANQRARSFGKRRKRQATESQEARRAPILQSVSANEYTDQAPNQRLASLDSLSTVMKPGKAFEFVRKLMLPTSETTETPLATSGDHQSLPPERSQEEHQQEFDSAPVNAPPEVNESTNDDATLAGSPLPSPSPPPLLSQPTLTKSILMHADEKVVPSTGSDFTVTRNLAPYGRFPSLDEETNFSTSTRATTTTTLETSESLPSENTDLSTASNGLFTPSQVVDQITEPIERPKISSTTTSGGITISSGGQEEQSSEHSMPASTSSSNGASMSPKDMPLRFSILVGENQPLAGATQAAEQPVIMNSTSVDMDHIVIPGRKGQLDTDSGGDQLSTSNSITESTSAAAYGDSYLDHNNNNAPQRPSGEQPAKRNASYEQTFDALPSNSIPSEVQMNHHHHATSLRRNPVRSASSESTAAASQQDCQPEAGKSRMRTIIWTGSIVIALNVCLIILSLVMYFKKVHLRANHTIVRSLSDCATQRSEIGGRGNRAGRWPSVILKSKNQLGSTSLNTHEHFFCKLNSKPADSNGARNGPSGPMEHDYNWPNLSTSSSRSTISSLASPIPSTSIRVNQMRPSLKSAPFDAHSTLRNGNFNTGGMGHESSSDRDEYNARYTNNIDILHSDRF